MCCFGRMQPWIKFEVFNGLNNQKLIASNTDIAADALPRPREGSADG